MQPKHPVYRVWHLCPLRPPLSLLLLPSTSAKINISYSILFNLTTSYSFYFGGKKGISRNKTSFFLLMYPPLMVWTLFVCPCAIEAPIHTVFSLFMPRNHTLSNAMLDQACSYSPPFHPCIHSPALYFWLGLLSVPHVLWPQFLWLNWSLHHWLAVPDYSQWALTMEMRFISDVFRVWLCDILTPFSDVTWCD